MTKREKRKLIQSVWAYLNKRISEAFEAKDEREFDWYSDGQEAFWHILREEPITITRRVKPL